MFHGARQHIGDGFNPAVGVPRKARHVIARGLAAKIVEQQEGVSVAGLTKTKGAVQVNAGTLHRGAGNHGAFDGADRHGVLLFAFIAI